MLVNVEEDQETNHVEQSICMSGIDIKGLLVRSDPNGFLPLDGRAQLC